MAHNGQKLPDDAKVFVVQALACYDPPSVVAAAVKQEWGVEITPQGVECYDPTKRAGRQLSQKLRLLFEETRKTFRENTAEIGIANRAVRLRMLERLAMKAEKQGALGLAAQLLKQAAEEVGDVYTNKRQLDGSFTVNHDHRVLAMRDRIEARRREIAERTTRALPAPGGGDARKLDS